jgi:ABC-2 type transport system ATP-binding protein
MDALSYRGVRKNFGDVEAVKPLDLDIPAGRIFGLLGPNGAGKTTLIRMTLGIILPDEGSISVYGEPKSRKHENYFGYLPEDRGLYPKMKVWELLVFFGQLRGLSAKEAKKRALAGLDRLGLAEWAENKVEELSKGMQQKIQLLTALIHKPKVAILDEPFSGLDPVNMDLFKEVIKETLEQGTNIVLSTHQMEQVEQMCERIALINKGQIVLSGEVGEIRSRYGSKEIRVEYSGDAPAADTVDGLVQKARLNGHEARYTLKEGVPLRDLLAAILQAGGDVVRFGEEQASMHDIFVTVVTGNGEVGHEG